MCLYEPLLRSCLGNAQSPVCQWSVSLKYVFYFNTNNHNHKGGAFMDYFITMSERLMTSW